jgi:hypothetical protein
MVIKRDSLLYKFTFEFLSDGRNQPDDHTDVCTVFWRLLPRLAVLPIVAALFVVFVAMMAFAELLCWACSCYGTFSENSKFRPISWWPSLFGIRLVPAPAVLLGCFLFFLHVLGSDLTAATEFSIIMTTSITVTLGAVLLVISREAGLFTPMREKAIFKKADDSAGFTAVIVQRVKDYKAKHCTIIKIED